MIKSQIKQAERTPEYKIAQRCRKIYGAANTLAEANEACNSLHIMWLATLDLDASMESRHIINKYLEITRKKVITLIPGAVKQMTTQRDKIERSLEDYYSTELENTGKCENLGITAEELSARARKKYGSDSAAATGTVLCDLIDEFIESIEWD